MKKVSIKPLTSNRLWRGRRFKSHLYRSYEEELLWKLPELTVPDGELHLSITAGIRKNADIDNVAKPFIDILQKKYGFNDSRIMKLTMHKVCGEGYFIEFEIEKYEEK